jgi:hypothetical protein
MRPNVVIVIVAGLCSVPHHTDAQSAGVSAAALPMQSIEACAVDFRGSMGVVGRWGGLIAVYDATSDNDGGVVAINRRPAEKMINGVSGKDIEHLQANVKLDQFEACIRRWRSSRMPIT